MNHFTRIFGCVCLCFLGWLNAAGVKAEKIEAEPARQAESGSPLAWDHQQFHFELPGLVQGNVTSDQFVGDITLCFFGADWNTASKDQLAWLNEFWLKYKLLGVQLVVFCVDPDPKNYPEMVKQNNWQFPCARLYSRQLIISSAPVKGLPTLLILAPGGIIYRKYEGVVLPETLEKDVLNLLRQKNQPPAF